MIALLAIPACAILNRVRGGGFGASVLPGHPRYYVAPVMGAIAFAVSGDPWRAVSFAAAYLIWSLLPWGHCIGLGRYAPDRDAALLEKDALILSRGNPWVALLMLEVIGIVPAAIAVSLLALCLPPLFVAAYEIGWRLRPKAPIELAELLVGALWGALLIWG